MKIVFDNIIYSLQKSGGGSVYWTELISRFSKMSTDVVFFDQKESHDNIFRKAIKLQNVKKETKWFLKIRRYLPFTEKIEGNLFFISVIIPGKPESLANQFLDKKYRRNKTIGFAYSPVTETFINFGYIDPLLVFFLLGRFLTFIEGYKNQLCNLIVFILIINFCRSEMSAYLYLVVFISLFFLTKQVNLK